MNPSEVLILAFLIGVVAGLRSMTAPAVVAWGARCNWLDLHGTRLYFMGSTAAVIIFTLLAIVELIADKLPSTPSRLQPAGLIARIMLGALGGAGIVLAGTQSLALGAVSGAAGGVAGAFAGHAVRIRLVSALQGSGFCYRALRRRGRDWRWPSYRLAILRHFSMSASDQYHAIVIGPG